MAPGFTEPLARGVERVLDTSYEKFSTTPFGQKAIDYLWSMEQVFRTHPALEPVFKMANEGIKARQSVGNTLYQPLNALKKDISADKTLSLMHNYQGANAVNLSTIYNSFPQGSPARTSAARLMNQDASHYAMSLPDIEAKLSSQANAHGRETAFGPHSVNLAATLYPLLRGSPTDKTKAEAVLSVLSMVFKDNSGVWNMKGVEKSLIKSDVQKWIKGQLKQYYGKQTAAGFGMNLKAEFTRQHSVEQSIQKYGMAYLAPGIFVAHLADFVKLPATVPAKALWDTLTRMGPANLEAMKTASGIFFHSYHSIIHNDFLYRTGAISKITGLPEVGAIVNKLFHNPGFQNLRKFQIGIFGSAGYHSAQLWAHQALRGDLGAISALKDLNLDPQAIIARGGTLTPEETEQAIYHFVNNRLFIDKPISRAFMSSANPYTRIGNMFHGYITREGQLITHELLRMMKANDYVGIAQFAGTLGIVFPYTAAPLLESLGVLVRTASPSQAWQNLSQDESNLWGGGGFKAWAGTYLQLLAHIGGASAFMNYVHAAANHGLAAAVLGPVPQVATEVLQDVITPLAKPSKSAGGDWRPFERDFLRYMTVPLLGSWAANHLISKGRRTSRSRLRLRIGGR